MLNESLMKKCLHISKNERGGCAARIAVCSEYSETLSIFPSPFGRRLGRGYKIQGVLKIYFLQTMLSLQKAREEDVSTAQETKLSSAKYKHFMVECLISIFSYLIKTN